jgi:hypothetical protein
LILFGFAASCFTGCNSPQAEKEEIATVKKLFSLICGIVFIVIILRFYSSLPSGPKISDISSSPVTPNQDQHSGNETSPPPANSGQPSPPPNNSTGPGAAQNDDAGDDNDPDRAPPDDAPAELANADQNLTLFSTAGIRMKANREGSFNGCQGGELVLNASSFSFTCPSDTHKSVQVQGGEVKGLHKNGVELISGPKYHFDVLNLDTTQTEILFCNWLSQQRTMQCPSQN